MKIDARLQNSLKIRKLMPVEQIIALATSCILKNTPKGLHERIKNRINCLTFKIQSDLTSSEFVYENDTIFINPNHISDVNVYLHEMMHAVGTSVFEKDVKIGLNLRRFLKLDENVEVLSNFGYGVNEGLNQHYTENFLPSNIQKSEVASSYSFCANLMSSLEKLVGEKECKMAHFSGEGVEYLINKMVNSCHLKNENKAIKFILQVDAFQRIAQTHLTFGAEYSIDSRMMLLDCYKSLITLALIKAKFENKDITLNDIITNEHIEGDNFTYLKDYMLFDLVKYFHKEKTHINSKTSDFVGMQSKPFLYYSNLILEYYFKTGKIIDGNLIPDEVKCGELFNYLFLNCKYYENGSPMGLYTNDFHKALTIATFEKSNNYMPNNLHEKSQLIRHIFSSKNVVRSGAEISDDCIIEACDDLEFNYFMIETMPNYYKSIFDKISEDIKQNVPLMKKVLTEVFDSNMEKYRLAKTLSKELLENEEIAPLFIIKINGKDKDLTK